MNIHNKIIDSYIEVKNTFFLKSTMLFNENIDNYIPIANCEKEQIRQNSIYFNVFDFFKINEPLHSKLLGTLLDPYSNHGQGKLFLKEFLEVLDIKYQDDDIWQVTAEIGRIDILLKCLNRPSVVIIENKSNGAVDQSNQLYRYWYQEIYLPFEKDKLPHEKDKLSETENFKIIYLTANDSKSFEIHTLEKPKELPEVLEKKIGYEKIHKITFKKEIVNWLKICLEKLPQTNSRMKEYVKQYIDLWEMKY